MEGTYVSRALVFAHIPSVSRKVYIYKEIIYTFVDDKSIICHLPPPLTPPHPYLNKKKRPEESTSYMQLFSPHQKTHIFDTHNHKSTDGTTCKHRDIASKLCRSETSYNKTDLEVLVDEEEERRRRQKEEEEERVRTEEIVHGE